MNSSENKTIAHTSMKNLLKISQDNPLVKTLPLIDNKETIGSIQLCFNLKTFNDTSFDDDIKFLKEFGINKNNSSTADDKLLFYNPEIFKPRKYGRPVSCPLLKTTNRSKEDLTSDYLMGKFCFIIVNFSYANKIFIILLWWFLGKDMASDEEEEALNTLKIMPSAESMVSAAEQIGIYSPPLSPTFSPLQVQVINLLIYYFYNKYDWLSHVITDLFGRLAIELFTT